MVQLDTPDSKGFTERQHLLKGGGTVEMFPELQPVQLERGSEYLLGHFAALSNTRGVGLSGPLAITFQDIKAYCELMQEPLSPIEIETIRAIDRAFLEENHKLDTKKD